MRSRWFIAGCFALAGAINLMQSFRTHGAAWPTVAAVFFSFATGYTIRDARSG